VSGAEVPLVAKGIYGFGSKPENAVMKFVVIGAALMLSACAAVGSYREVQRRDAEGMKTAPFEILCWIHNESDNPLVTAELHRRNVIRPQMWSAVDAQVGIVGMNETELQCALPAERVNTMIVGNEVHVQWKARGAYYFTTNGVVTGISY
jgi:methionine synthase II (cobalamin-independent)